MDIFHAIILGIVEGITEFLPISSTGHLILTSKLLGLSEDSFTKSFDIIIQLGAIAAVVVLYWKKVIGDIDLCKKVLVGFIPTAILGLVFYKVVKGLQGDVGVVAWALILGGIILIVFELWQSKKNISSPETEELTYKQAVLIGVFQSIAFIPGVSRSAATIIGGQLIGLGRKAIVEFSFLLAVPTMLAATSLDIVRQANSFTSENIGLLLIGFIVSFLVAWAAIKTFLSYIQNHSFIVFGVYRIIVGIIFLIALYY